MTSAEINAAIRARVAAGGGEVLIPNGTHVITEPITLASNVVICGESPCGVVYHMEPVSHGPCFQKPAGASIFRWGVRNATIDYSARGTPSADPADCAFSFPQTTGSAWQFEVADVDVRYAHTAWNAKYQVFMGKVARFWSCWCRNGIVHWTGTTMAFENCFSKGTNDSPNGSVPGAGWDLRQIVGCVLSSCAMDNWTSDHPFVADSVYGLVVQGFDAEANRSLGGAEDALFVLRASQCSWQGSSFVGNRVTTKTGQRSALLLIDGGQVSMQGVAWGGSPRPYPDTADGLGVAVAVLIKGDARTAVAFAGSAIQPPDGSAGVRVGVISEVAVGGHATFTGCQGIGGDIEAWSDYPTIILRHGDGSVGMRLHRAIRHMTVIDADLPVAYRDVAGNDVLWLSREAAYLKPLRGAGTAPVVVDADGRLMRG